MDHINCNISHAFYDHHLFQNKTKCEIDACMHTTNQTMQPYYHCQDIYMSSVYGKILSLIRDQMESSDSQNMWNTDPPIIKLEKNLRKEIIKIIESGNTNVLKPNTDEAVIVVLKFQGHTFEASSTGMI